MGNEYAGGAHLMLAIKGNRTEIRVAATPSERGRKRRTGSARSGLEGHQDHPGAPYPS